MTTAVARATDHTHPSPDGGTETHNHPSHDAEPGHSHHSDSQYGQLGPMVESDSADPVDFDSAEDFMDPTHDHDDVTSGAGELNSSRPPRSNLIRARLGTGVGLRSADGDSPGVLYGIFSEFDTWYEVDSFWEGHFLERVAPGAFKDTIANDRGSMRVLFDHGMDFQLNFKPLGPIQTLEERAEGPYYEVPLYNTDYNRDQIVPLLSGTLLNGETAGSGLGASFRFEVLEESWNAKPKASKRNPAGIPERTIQKTKVYEFGPVTFPANPGATAGVRSLSDAFLERLTSDSRFFHGFSERVGKQKARKILDSVPETLRQPRRESSEPRQGQLRRQALALLATARV